MQTPPIFSIQGNVDASDLYLTARAPLALSPWLDSVWQLSVPEGSYTYRAIPDNCIDWLINVDNSVENFLIPPFTQPLLNQMSGPVTYFGLRFRTLGLHHFAQYAIGDWSNEQSYQSAKSILPINLFETVGEIILDSPTFKARSEKVFSLFQSTRMQEVLIDRRLDRFMQYCYHNPKISLSEKQCGEFGISARQLRRLSQLHLGLTPKEFLRVIRLQKLLNSTILMPDFQDYSLWPDLFYDQSHFCREFKSLTGLTPLEFSRMSVFYNT